MASRVVEVRRYWPCTPEIYSRYLVLYQRYEQLMGDEDCDEAYVIRDELRCLPGWPQDIDENTIVIPVDESTTIVSVPASLGKLVH